ncbi:hypothetical protein N566_25500 [Streptomycetaceae bacterium MP113-05]|nr:hypothetical protein N566_25500 [Streptomycetaceae bacterium MP113-05]
MTRRPVAAITAAVLTCEAVMFVLLQTFMGMVVDKQQMSLAGLDPGMMSLGSLIGGALLGGYLLLCAGVLVVTAVRDRAPGDVPRLLLISAAVLHALLGAATVGLVGWSAFAFMMLVLALLVWTLVSYSRLPKHRRTEGGSQPSRAAAGTATAGPTAG